MSKENIVLFCGRFLSFNEKKVSKRHKYSAQVLNDWLSLSVVDVKKLLNKITECQ